jgi:hypothetical protein
MRCTVAGVADRAATEIRHRDLGHLGYLGHLWPVDINPPRPLLIATASSIRRASHMGLGKVAKVAKVSMPRGRRRLRRVRGDVVAHARTCERGADAAEDASDERTEASRSVPCGTSSSLRRRRVAGFSASGDSAPSRVQAPGIAPSPHTAGGARATCPAGAVVLCLPPRVGTAFCTGIALPFLAMLFFLGGAPAAGKGAAARRPSRSPRTCPRRGAAVSGGVHGRMRPGGP